MTNKMYRQCPTGLIYDLKFFLMKPMQAFNRFATIYERAKEQTLLTEIFMQQSYYWLINRLKEDTTVLDLGAYIGDTAIYFARSKEVKRVISFEINPKTYKKALKNINLSPFKEKIEIYNIAASKRAIEMSIGRQTIIKCDIEGAEAELFKDLNLENVYALMIETHDINSKKLMSRLKKQGFKTEYISKKGIAFKELGMIHAYK